MLNKTLIFIFFVAIFSCQQAKEQKTVQRSDSVLIKEFREQDKKWQEEDKLLVLEKEKKEQDEQEKQYKIEDIHQDSALQNALAVAKKVFHLNHFEKKYDLDLDGNSNIHIEITIGYFFNNTQKALFIRREVFPAVYFDLYRIINNVKVEHWFRIDYSHFNSSKVLFSDINGDGFNDFIINWHPMSGCCRANMYDVYLYLPQKNDFSGKYDFINPTFYPAEKVIRGVGYGRPGEAELYKYKWNGLKVDTIEFVYNLLGKNDSVSFRKGYLKTKKARHYLKSESGVILKEVPQEYLTIQDYDWFSSFMPRYNYGFYDDDKK